MIGDAVLLVIPLTCFALALYGLYRASKLIDHHAQTYGAELGREMALVVRRAARRAVVAIQFMARRFRGKQPRPPC